MWPYLVTGNFVVKSVVDSDIQVNGGADADPKKQVCVGGGGGGGGGYGLRFGLKIGKGPECEPPSSPGFSPTHSLSFPRTKTFCSLPFEFPKQDFQCFNIDT